MNLDTCVSRFIVRIGLFLDGGVVRKEYIQKNKLSLLLVQSCLGLATIDLSNSMPYAPFPSIELMENLALI